MLGRANLEAIPVVVMMLSVVLFVSMLSEEDDFEENTSLEGFLMLFNLLLVVSPTMLMMARVKIEVGVSGRRPLMMQEEEATRKASGENL